MKYIMMSSQKLQLPKLTMDVLNGIAQFKSEAEEANADDSEKQVVSRLSSFDVAGHC